MSTLTVKSFDGSLTDFYIGADQSSYEQADNFVHNEYSKLISRPGSLLDFTNNTSRAQVSGSVGTRRISLLAPQTTGSSRNFTLLKLTGDHIEYDNGGNKVELFGPTGGSAFEGVGTVDVETGYAATEWNKHTIITTDEMWQRSLKVYNDASGVLQLRTAGLPKPGTGLAATGGSGAAYIYATVFKYEYTVGDITYIDRSAPTLTEVSNVGSGTPGSSPGIGLTGLPVLTNTYGTHYDTTNVDVEIYRTTNAGTVLYLAGTVDNGTTTFSDTTSDNTLDDGATLYTTGGVLPNDRPPICKYVHGTSDFTYYANIKEVSPTTGGDLQLQPQRLMQSKRGDTDSVPTGNYADMEQEIVGISSVRSIPVVFCKNQIYRIDGYYDNQGRGQMVPKKISDSVGAAGHLSLIQTIDGIYFAGTDGFYFTDGYQVVPASKNSRLFKDTYFKLVDSALKRKRICGAYDINEHRVLWGTSHITEEAYDDDNARCFVLDLEEPKPFVTWSSGFQDAEEIANEVTGTNADSIITVADTTGLDEGAYVFRDDELYPLQPAAFLSYVLTSTTLALNPTLQSPASRSSKTYKFVNQSPKNVFFRNFLPTALCFANDTLYMGDRHGLTRYFDKEQPNDVWIDPSGATEGCVYGQLPIYFQYKGAALDLGTTEYRKYVSGMLIKARPRLDINAEMTLQVLGENDDNENPHELIPIFFESFYPWGTPSLSYGDPRLYRALRTIIDVKRRFPAGKMRCEYKQIHMMPALVNIYLSSVYSNATIESSVYGANYKMVTITDTWPIDIANYWFSSVADDYTKIFRIAVRQSGMVIHVFDPLDELAQGSDVKWVAQGLLKNALINLIEYSIFYEIIGPSQQAYNGENAVTQ